MKRDEKQAYSTYHKYFKYIRKQYEHKEKAETPKPAVSAGKITGVSMQSLHSSWRKKFKEKQK